MPKQAVVYLRQSNDHEGSVSLDVQEADCRAECARNGWAVAAVIVDNNVSGSVPPADREGMSRALGMLADVDVLMPARLDRLSRVLEDCLALRRVCNAADVEIVTADGQITETNASMMFPLLGMVAEWEKERTAERTAKGRRRVLAERRVRSVAPYGYRIARKEGGAFLDIDPVPAEDIREIAAHIIAGMTVADVVHVLNSHGVPTPRDHARIRAGRAPKGDRWAGNTVRRMLASPAVRGIRARWDKAQGEAVECLRADGTPDVIAEPILDASTWHAVRRAIADRAQPRTQPAKTDSLLTGLIHCGVCGTRMAHSMQSSGGKRHRMYRCCKGAHVAIRADRTEDEIAARFLEDFGPLRIRREVTAQRRDVTAELADAERGIEGLTSLAMSDPDNAAMLAPKLTELRTKRDALIAERDAAREPTYEDTGETFADVWARADSVGRRGLLSKAGVVVTIGKRTVRDKRVWDPSRIRLDVTDPATVHMALELASGADEDSNGLADSGPARVRFAA